MAYPLSNILIDALPEDSRCRLMGEVRRVALPRRTSLYEQGTPPRYAHFLTSGIASVVTTMNDGVTSEVSTLGREGMPQALHLLGDAPMPTHCFMQIDGTGLRIEYRVLQRLFHSDEALRRVLLLYVQYQAMMLGQVAGCNRLHGVNERLARWLLMVLDRTGDHVMRLTQEFLGQMIGSQRTTVSEAAQRLQVRGLIVYARGSITVLDRPGLEKVSCECYHVTRRLLEDVYKLGRQTVLEDTAA